MLASIQGFIPVKIQAQPATPDDRVTAPLARSRLRCSGVPYIPESAGQRRHEVTVLAWLPDLLR